MAKAFASDSIMAPDKMKPLLALSKREPVQVAFGLSTDGDGLILLDKKAKPKKVVAMLKAAAAKAKLALNASSLRYGRAEVDTEYDAGTIRMFVNKEASGAVRAKLIEVVKRIPYQKVEINVDPAIEQEPESDEGAQEAVADTATETQPADTASAEPPAQAARPADAAALTGELGRLIGRIAAAAGDDAGRRATLAKLAADANAMIKSGDTAGAGDAIARLREALDTPPAGATATAAAPDAAALRKELVGMIGQIATAAGDDAGRKAALAKLANDANAALKGADVAAAVELIARLRGALTEPGAGGTDATDEQMASLRERLDICKDDLRRVAGEAGAALARSAQEIEALLAGGRTGPAASLIDVLETQIAEAIRAARQESVQEEAGHMVEFGQLLLRWRDAQGACENNLKTFSSTLLARPEIQADPRLDAIQQAIGALPSLIPTFGGKLEDLLNDGLNAVDPAQKTRLAAEASAAIDTYRQQLAAASQLVALEQFAARDLGASVSLHGALDEALAELKQKLAA